MHPIQKSSWGNSSRVGSPSVCKVGVEEDGVQNQMPFQGSEAGLTLPSKGWLSSRSWVADGAGLTLVHRSSRNTSTCGTQATLQKGGLRPMYLGTVDLGRVRDGVDPSKVTPEDGGWVLVRVDWSGGVGYLCRPGSGESGVDPCEDGFEG